MHVQRNAKIYDTPLSTFDGRRPGAGMVAGMATWVQPRTLAAQTQIKVVAHLAVNAPAEYVRLTLVAFVSEK